MNDTTLIQNITGDCIISFIIRTVHAQIVFLGKCCFKYFILPIYARICTIPIVLRSRRINRFTGTGIYFGSTRIWNCFIRILVFIKHLRCFIPIHRICISIQHIQFLHYFRYSEISTEADIIFSFCTTFGSNQYHTICTTRSIDSCGRGIFQDLNRFDIRRINCRKRIGCLHHTVFACSRHSTTGKRNTIHDIKRFGRGGE